MAGYQRPARSNGKSYVAQPTDGKAQPYENTAVKMIEAMATGADPTNFNNGSQIVGNNSTNYVAI